jgi:hypothetical protein
VEVEENEQSIGFVFEFVFFVQTIGLTNTSIDMSRDGNTWTKICSKM